MIDRLLISVSRFGDPAHARADARSPAVDAGHRGGSASSRDGRLAAAFARLEKQLASGGEPRRDAPRGSYLDIQV